MIILSIINILVLLVTAYAVWQAPIKAVEVGQRLQREQQDRDRKYQAKLHVFTTILGNRHAKGFSETFVIAINQIPIIFADNQKVLDASTAFIRLHKNILKMDDAKVKELDGSLNDLVILMASDLGYNHVNNALMQNFFYPGASQNFLEANNLPHRIYLDDYKDKSGVGLPTD